MSRPLSERQRQGAGLGDVPERRRGGVGVGVVELVRADARVREGQLDRARRLATVRARLDHVERVGGGAVAHELRVRLDAAGARHLLGLEDEQPDALAHDKPVAGGIERPCGAFRRVVGPRREGPDDVERPEGERAQRDLRTTGDRGVDRPVANRAQRLAEGDRARGTGVGGRKDRPAQPKGDPDVRGRRAAEHRKGEIRCDRSDAAFQVPLVLALGVGDPAERAAEVNPEAIGVRAGPRRRRVGRDAGVAERELPGGEPEVAEPIELASGLRVHVVKRVEVVDLGGDLRAERRWIEPVDPLHRRSIRPDAGPHRVAPGPDRRDYAEAGDPDAPTGHVEVFGAASVSDRPRASTASAIDLNVASVRPAMGRTKSRSTINAHGPKRGRKSCSIET